MWAGQSTLAMKVASVISMIASATKPKANAYPDSD
jgi:hypothetical protein